MKNFKNKYFDISKPVFIPAAIITFLFVSLTILFSKDAEAGFSGFQYYMSSNFGWFITLCINYFLIFCAVSGIQQIWKYPNRRERRQTQLQ